MFHMVALEAPETVCGFYRAPRNNVAHISRHFSSLQTTNYEYPEWSSVSQKFWLYRKMKWPVRFVANGLRVVPVCWVPWKWSITRHLNCFHCVFEVSNVLSNILIQSLDHDYHDARLLTSANMWSTQETGSSPEGDSTPIFKQMEQHVLWCWAHARIRTFILLTCVYCCTSIVLQVMVNLLFSCWISFSFSVCVETVLAAFSFCLIYSDQYLYQCSLAL